MDKEHPRRRGHLTPREKREIRRLNLAGKRNVDICRELGLTRNTVHKALVKIGLPITRRPPLPEKEVLALLRKRVEFRTIGRVLHVSQRSVAQFARQHGFGRPRKELSGAQALRLIEDILNRNASAAALAKKYGCSYKRVLSLAHLLLSCERFLPSWRAPLESYLPSRSPLPIKRPALGDANDTEANCLKIIDVISKCLGNTFPEDAGPRAELCTEIAVH